MQRPRDAAGNQPAEAEAERHHAETDNNNAVACPRLRQRQRRRRLLGGLPRALDDFIRLRLHLLAFDFDQGAVRIDLVEVLDPLAECVGISLHLHFERVLHRRCAVDFRENLVEPLVASEEFDLGQFRLTKPVFGFLVPHDQQGHHEFAGVGVGQPGHAFIDDAFDRSVGNAEFAPQPRGIVEAEGFLLLH